MFTVVFANIWNRFSRLTHIFRWFEDQQLGFHTKKGLHIWLCICHYSWEGGQTKVWYISTIFPSEGIGHVWGRYLMTLTQFDLTNRSKAIWKGVDSYCEIVVFGTFPFEMLLFPTLHWSTWLNKEKKHTHSFWKSHTINGINICRAWQTWCVFFFPGVEHVYFDGALS